MRDPVLGWDSMLELKKSIRNCPEPIQIAEGGHFVQERGVALAEACLDVF
jgi:hypothetical protein